MSKTAAESTPITYISTITAVREVALSGAADLLYWRDQLRPARLVPYDDNGRASLLLTAIESRFRGIPFRELSIAVRVGDGGDAYLAHAFNSSRLLAFAERAFFRTPYHLAELTVDEQIPAQLGVLVGNRALINAQMGPKGAPARREDAVFDGPIYLPGGKDVFFARLSGAADIYLFDPGDTVTFGPQSDVSIITQLTESGFTGTEWLVRSDAVHARSKTFKRTH